MPQAWIHACLASAILASATASLGAEIHLEHSYLPEGSSWGTDDAFRRALDLPEALVPPLYRTRILGNAPHFADTRGLKLAQGRFAGDRVALYRRIRICVDSSLPAPGPSFQEALETFSDQVAGLRSNGRLFSIEALDVDASEAGAAGCDIVAIRGSWSTFPYRYLPDSAETPRSSRYGKVYGLFYRASESAIPVITIHPEIDLDFSPPLGRYIQETRTRLRVDGRVLMLHELGHILGFAHIRADDAALDFPEASAMGSDAAVRSEDALALRFRDSTDLWRYWDAYQTTIYRRIWQRELNPRCPEPQPGFTPLAGLPLSEVVARFNERISRERPWGARPLSEEFVVSEVQSRVKQVPEGECDRFRSVISGSVPEGMELYYLSETGHAGAAAGRRYYFVRIGTPSGPPPAPSSGFSLAIGSDLMEMEGERR